MEKQPKSLEFLVEESEKEKNVEPSPTVLEITLKELFSFEKLEMKSDLSQDLILAMSRGMTFTDIFHSEALEELMRYILKLSVSKDRKGREEMVELSRNSVDPMDDNGNESMFRRLFNGS